MNPSLEEQAQDASQSAQKSWQIPNATLVDDSDFRESKDIVIKGTQFQKVLSTSLGTPTMATEKGLSISSKDAFLYPGLINSFDNFLACYYPFDSPERPYTNWLAYDNDLKSSDLFRERMLVESQTLYLLGSYRSILGGVTTVLDHIPHQIHRALASSLPVKLLADFGINHSVGNYHLGWGGPPEEEHSYAKANDLPYVLRVGEGTDRFTAQDVRRLTELEILDQHTVLIQALNLSPWDVQAIANANAHIVWVPEVQHFLYGGVSTPIADCLAAGIPISLATGPAMQGSKNMFSTMRFVAQYLQNKEIWQPQPAIDESEIPRLIFRMLHKNPLAALRLKKTGGFSAGSAADFFLMDRKKDDPYENLLYGNPWDIRLLCVDGQPTLADPSLASLFHYLNIQYETITLKNKYTRIIRIPQNNRELYGFKQVLSKTTHKKNPFDFLYP